MAGSLLTAGCVSTIPEDTFAVTAEQLKQRQTESRRYDGLNENEILAASANVLQDLGFNLGHSDEKLGVLTASKEREAGNAAQLTGSLVIAFLGVSVAREVRQDIKVSLVVRPALDSTGKPIDNTHIVRISFQRWVYTSDGNVRAETLTDPLLYQQFFDKLSTSVFIEAQKI